MPAQTSRILVDDPKATQRLFESLKTRARGQTELVRVTRADAVALSGLPVAEAEPALKALVRSYKSHVSVTEEGELVYAFDPALERRDRATLRERLAQLAATGYRGFRWFFKVWIMVTLVVYVLAFLAMMISLVLARSGSDDRDDRRGGGGGLPWIWFWLMPDLAPQNRYQYSRALNRPRKRFYQSIFDFVFGPPQVAADPREADRQLISYLRDHHGRIAAADLVALTGISFDEADEELTRLLVEYDGEVTVAEDGTLLYAFSDLLKSAAPTSQSAWRYAWDAETKVAPLTGNSSAANAVVGGFAGFNLLASLTIGPAFLERVHLGSDPTALFFISWFPLLFSLLFFAVPTLRWVKRRRQIRRNEHRRLRRALIREIWTRPGEPLDPDLLTRAAAKRAQSTDRAELALPEAKKILDELLGELDGDVTTDEAGAVRYLFPRIAAEQQVVEEARTAAPKETLGPVVFSSED